jgi:hypothetical protein
MDKRKLVRLKDRIVSNANYETWYDIGLLTDCDDLISEHHRLLRSLHFGDEDYGGNVAEVLQLIAYRDEGKILAIEKYLDEKFPEPGEYISARPSERKITFAPSVFHIPDLQPEEDFISIMMPFAREFDAVYKAVGNACRSAGFRFDRADNIWEDSIIIQDIFNLIFRSRAVIVDFSNRNPNVLYETGIAHTLGKLVIPIVQNMADVPFDLAHHRVQRYLPNAQGLEKLEADLHRKLSSITKSF